MAFGAKTNERPGTRASVRHLHVSAYKAREVLDLIRGKHVSDADEILQFVERDVAIAIRKVLASAVANAQNNDGQDPETLFVSACYADEGPTMKRWRPRARGRATRIRKRTTHITIIVSRLGERELAQRADKAAAPGHTGRRTAARASEARRERVARSRRRDTEKAGLSEDEVPTDEVPADEVPADEVPADEVPADEVPADEVPRAGDIKGNRDSMKYHVPGSQWYEQTDAEEWFETIEEAEAAGYVPAGGEEKQQLEHGDIKGNRDSMKYHVPGSQWYEQTDAEEWFETIEEAEAAGYEPAGGEAKQHLDEADADEKDEK